MAAGREGHRQGQPWWGEGQTVPVTLVRRARWQESCIPPDLSRDTAGQGPLQGWERDWGEAEGPPGEDRILESGEAKHGRRLDSERCLKEICSTRTCPWRPTATQPRLSRKEALRGLLPEAQRESSPCLRSQGGQTMTGPGHLLAGSLRGNWFREVPPPSPGPPLRRILGMESDVL